MKKTMKAGILTVSAILIVFLGIFLFPTEKNDVNAATVTVSGNKVSNVQVNTVGKDKLKISWKKSAKYNGAKVYRYSNKKWKLVKTTKGTSYTTGNLKKNSTYQYAVKSYYKKSGKTYCSKLTYSVTARTYRSSKNNVSKISISTGSKTIYVGKGKTFKAKLGGSNLFNKTVRWSSSNSKIATVSSKGYVKGIKAGVVSIYAKAHNGKTVKYVVTIKKQPAQTTTNNNSTSGSSTSGGSTSGGSSSGGSTSGGSSSGGSTSGGSTSGGSTSGGSSSGGSSSGGSTHVHDQAGEVCGWVSSTAEVKAAAMAEFQYWSDLVDSGKITYDEYLKNCPSGWYEILCSCGLHSGGFYYDNK